MFQGDCTDSFAHSISGPMTGALVIYAATFMRYSLAVTPPNYLLFACHLTNFGAQSTQAYRYLNYWKYVTSRDKALQLCLVYDSRKHKY